MATIPLAQPAERRACAAVVRHQLLVSGELGGATHIALHLAAHGLAHGSPVRIWTSADGPARPEAARLGLPTSLYNLPAAYSRNRLRAALSNGSLALRLRLHGGGLAHIHSIGAYGAVRHGLRLAGVTRIVHVHSTEPETDLRWSFRVPPELIVTCNRPMRDVVGDVLDTAGRPDVPVVVVPNAVDADRFTPGDRAAAKSRVGAPPNRPLLVMLANLAPIKGQETAIRMMALLKARGTDALLWMAGVERSGETEYTEILKQVIAAEGVGDRAVLLGQRGDAPDLLRAADVFLLPSSTEGMPLSVLEAQASGAPVVASPVGGVPEIVEDGATGFLAAHDDPAAFAAAVTRLLGDRDLGARLAAAARRRIEEEHTWPTFCRRLDDVYAEALARRRQP